MILIPTTHHFMHDTKTDHIIYLIPIHTTHHITHDTKTYNIHHITHDTNTYNTQQNV